MTDQPANTGKIEDLFKKIRTMNQWGERWDMEAAASLSQTYPATPEQIYEWGNKIVHRFKNEHNAMNSSVVHKMECFLGEQFDFKRNIISGELLWREQGNNPWSVCRYNDVWRIMHHHIGFFKDKDNKKPKIGISDVTNLLESSYVPEYNPFKEYFESLPAWDGIDHIAALGKHITCEDQDFWMKMFEKSMVRMIACSYGLHENRIINVFVQEEQEKGKDTFIRFLCPPELHDYYKEDPLEPGKDTEIALTKNFIWNLTELDQLNRREISEIKAIISRKVVKQRAAYARQEESRSRVVNLWGSTNKVEFLTDDRNTRWLCFIVKDISWAYSNTIDIQKVWAQAWHLYKSNYDYTLNKEEKHYRDTKNKEFEVMPDEKQLILANLTKTHQGEGEFLMAADIQLYLSAVTGNKIRLNSHNITRSMQQLGFAKEQRIIGNAKVRGFWARKKPLAPNANGFEHAQQQATPQLELGEEPPF